MPTRNTRGSCDLSLPVTLLTMITGDPIPAPGAASASSIQRKQSHDRRGAWSPPAGGLLPDLIICKSGRSIGNAPVEPYRHFAFKAKEFRGRSYGPASGMPEITRPASRYGRDRPGTALLFEQRPYLRPRFRRSGAEDRSYHRECLTIGDEAFAHCARKVASRPVARVGRQEFPQGQAEDAALPEHAALVRPGQPRQSQRGENARRIFASDEPENGERQPGLRRERPHRDEGRSVPLPVAAPFPGRARRFAPAEGRRPSGRAPECRASDAPSSPAVPGIGVGSRAGPRLVNARRPRRGEREIASLPCGVPAQHRHRERGQPSSASPRRRRCRLGARHRGSGRLDRWTEPGRHREKPASFPLAPDRHRAAPRRSGRRLGSAC